MVRALDRNQSSNFSAGETKCHRDLFLTSGVILNKALHLSEPQTHLFVHYLFYFILFTRDEFEADTFSAEKEIKK